MRRMLRSILMALPIVLILPVRLGASDWQELSTKLEQSVWASSVFCEQIRGQEVCYAPEQLFDGDPGTCWVEAAPGGGAGEWVLFTVNRPVEGLRLTNGFARSPTLFRYNNRVMRLRLSFVVGFTAPGLVTEMDYYLYFLTDLKEAEVQLQDTPEPQLVDFSTTYEEHRQLVWEALERFSDSYPFFMREIEKDLGLEPELGKEQLKKQQELIFQAFGMSCLRLEILEVYAGERCDDTCLSEIEVQFE